MEPIGSHPLYNAYDVNFIVLDDLYNLDPNTETTIELGKAIDKWKPSSKQTRSLDVQKQIRL